MPSQYNCLFSLDVWFLPLMRLSLNISDTYYIPLDYDLYAACGFVCSLDFD